MTFMSLRCELVVLQHQNYFTDTPNMRKSQKNNDNENNTGYFMLIQFHKKQKHISIYISDQKQNCNLKCKYSQLCLSRIRIS